VGDDEVEQPARDAVGLRQPEKTAERDAVVDHHPQHRQPKGDAEGERCHRNVDVVDHDQSGGLHALLRRDVGPELVVMDLVDEAGICDGVSGFGMREDDEKADERGHEEQSARGKQIWPGLAVGPRQGLDVKLEDSLEHVAAAAVDDSVAARDQSVEIAVNGLAGPVALRARQVGGRAPVELGHGQDLRGRECVEVGRAGAREQVFEPVPVGSPQGDEILRSHGAET